MAALFVKPPYVEMIAEGTLRLELRTSFLSAPLYVTDQVIASSPHNFDALENRACDISRDLGVPIVYTEDYLALKNSVLQQEI